MEPFCFGIIKGEQPLIRASRASKVAGAFLVLFCACKRVHIRRKSFLQKAQNFKHAKMLCTGSIFHIQKGRCTLAAQQPLLLQ